MAEQNTQSSKATHGQLSQLQSTSAELVVGVLAVLLLAAAVARLVSAFQTGGAPFMLLASASTSAAIALVFCWLRLQGSRAVAARNLTYLEKNEAWLASIIRSPMEAIISADETQRIVLFNPTAEILFGCSACQTIGRPLLDSTPERFRGTYEVYIWRSRTAGVSKRQMGKQRPLFVLYIDGREFPIEVSTLQIEVNGGKLFTMMLCDTTERVRTEATLRYFQEELQYLSNNILATCEEEWYRIAHEPHDDLGQRLSVLKMNTLLLIVSLQTTRSGKVLVDQTQIMQYVIDEVTVAVRQIPADLRPSSLGELGFMPSFERMAESFRRRLGLVVTAHAQELAMNEHAAVSAFRIMQEALNNVIHHADATRVEIESLQRDGILELSIQDNGHGRSGTPLTVGERKPPRLLDIHKRARSLGGQAMITHVPGGSFRLSVSFPVTRKAIEETPS